MYANLTNLTKISTLGNSSKYLQSKWQVLVSEDVCMYMLVYACVCLTDSNLFFICKHKPGRETAPHFRQYAKQVLVWQQHDIKVTCFYLDLSQCEYSVHELFLRCS